MWFGLNGPRTVWSVTDSGQLAASFTASPVADQPRQFSLRGEDPSGHIFVLRVDDWFVDAATSGFLCGLIQDAACEDTSRRT